MTDTLSPPPAPAGGPPGARGETDIRVPLSLQQQFLHHIDHGDDTGPFGPRYTIVGGWRVTGALDLDVLRRALDDVVVRHETLRTSIVRDGGEAYQLVRHPAPVPLEVRDLRAGPQRDRALVAEDFANEVEADVFGIDEMPLLRAVLGRFDARDAVLVVAAHHTAVDGWSVHLVVRDLVECYAARRDGRSPVLPPVRQYREYVRWQQETQSSAVVRRAREFWRENLRGAQVFAIPTDRTRSDEPFVTSWYRFLLDEEFRRATAELATRTRSTPFMVLLAAYLTQLREQTGRTDLVVPTFTPGRHPAWVQNTVGSFYNFLPIRTDLAGTRDFPEVVARVRTACLAAYAHELPFIQILEEAPDVMNEAIGPNAAACVFQVTQSPDMMFGQQYGDLHFAAMRRRVVSASVGSQIPDGVLFGLEASPEGGFVGSVGFTTNLFVESSVRSMVTTFRQTLADILTGPGRP
ncbi:condensation domain-containing protein [Micromonospora deserti]|uniref:Condensation protein n=1 Tax=Micromonospora deserti TaxID=2070366 RepID=A0A2W2D764_9ACTN|nr:condensation domain-containing protein [Micromonospora deserti]PZF96459.1 condensation protein [Micromonospora deserti]